MDLEWFRREAEAEALVRAEFEQTTLALLRRHGFDVAGAWVDVNGRQEFLVVW